MPKGGTELSRTGVVVSKEARAEETLKALRRRLSERRMMAMLSIAENTHVRFDVAGDENQDMVSVLFHLYADKYSGILRSGMD